MPHLELPACKVHPVLMVDRVLEVLRVYLACLGGKDRGEILGCLVILVYKVLLDHLDRHLCLRQKQMPVIHKQETMTKDQQLLVLQVNLVPGVLRGHKEDKAQQDHLDKMVLREYQETEAHRAQLVLLAHLVLGDEMATLAHLVQLDTLVDVADLERRELKD